MITRFAQGFALPIRGAALLWRTPALRRLAIVPLILNITLYIIAIGLFIQYYETGFGLLITRPAAWYWLIGYYVLRSLAFVATLGVFLFSFVFIGKALATPFLDILSEWTEDTLHGTPTNRPFHLGHWIVDILRSLGHTLGMLFLLTVAFPLSFIPVIGQAAWLGLGWLLLVYDFTGFALDRRRLTFREKWQRVLSDRAGSLGFGAALFVLLAIPVVNLFGLSIAAVSGTLLVCKQDRSSSTQPVKS
jgi:CysZ protein